MASLSRAADPHKPVTRSASSLLPRHFCRVLSVQAKDGRAYGSLFWHLNRTRTPGGARTLRGWLRSPLIDRNAIEDRLNAVEALAGRGSVGAGGGSVGAGTGGSTSAFSARSCDLTGGPPVVEWAGEKPWWLANVLAALKQHRALDLEAAASLVGPLVGPLNQ
jgi:hypothetical protein